MVCSLLVITRDIDLKNDIYRSFKNYNCMIRYEKMVMRALLTILENTPDVVIADLEIGYDSIIHMIDVMNKSQVRIPIIVMYEDESKFVLSELCESGILYRFQKPLDGDSIDQLKLVIDNIIEKSASRVNVKGRDIEADR